MSETENITPENKIEPKEDEKRKEERKKGRLLVEAKRFFRELWLYIKNLVSLTDDTDAEATMTSLSKGVEFRGDNIWLLFFAMIIASVGLNVNSTAVIIGAMLVSPLMGPIMGIGLSIGTNDSMLLRKSLRNLLTMVVISLLASSTYFLLTPLSDAQSELLARTVPTIFDVFIAFFGGLAGILASSRRNEKITVISGVAIATALMPPLCTAGYGIGTGQFNYFFGAFYLFFINSFFIALATFLMVRYLKFPKKVYIDSLRERRVRRSIAVFTIIVCVPSIFIAFNVVRESSFNSLSIKYLSDIENSEVMQEAHIIGQEKKYSRKGSEIQLSLVGKPLTAEQVSFLQQRLTDLGLKNTKLVIKQAGGGALDIKMQAEMLQDYIQAKDVIIAQKDSVIETLRDEISMVRQQNKVSAQQLAGEMVALYGNIEDVTMSEAVRVDVKTNAVDTIPTINIRWESTPSDEKLLNIDSWLKVRLKTDRVDVVNIFDKNNSLR